MFEDALFGHVRGAYTGAIGEAMGYLREANGGSAFFDEISGLPLPLQAKLLRAIETGVFRPIGAARDARSDFRPIAATNDDLSELVRDGRFRADLWHRMSGVVLRVPALVDRIDDVPLLARHFLGAAARVTDDAMAALMSRAWPGNVRELRQVLEAASVFANGAIDAAGDRRRGRQPRCERAKRELARSVIGRAERVGRGSRGSRVGHEPRRIRTRHSSRDDVPPDEAARNRDPDYMPCLSSRFFAASRCATNAGATFVTRSFNSAF